MFPSRRTLRLAVLLLAAAGASPAFAGDPCPDALRGAQAADAPAARIAAAACEEHRLWYRGFIDLEGRNAGSRVREAEGSALANGQAAWRRVVDYWRGSGLGGMASTCPGAVASCRAFVVDTPWSAAFISWVMRAAKVPGFDSSASHVRYVRHAYRTPEASAWRFADPATTAPATGDMLCYVRGQSRTLGFGGLGARVGRSDAGLEMHCDIVVGTDLAELAGGEDGIDGTEPGSAQPAVAYLVGGNVLDGVTMRLMALDADGRFAALPARAPAGIECSPDAQAACNANGQDWAVLLQLRGDAELAALGQGGRGSLAGVIAAGTASNP